MVIVPLGYTVSEVFAAGGNPYGTSYTSGHRATGPDASAGITSEVRVEPRPGCRPGIPKGAIGQPGAQP
jgi:hypothetical protein